MTNYRIVRKTNRIGEEFYLIQYQVFWFWWKYLTIQLGIGYSVYYTKKTIDEVKCKIIELKEKDLEYYSKKIIKTTIINN